MLSGLFPRSLWEERHGLGRNSSLGSAQGIIEGVGKEYVDRAQNFIERKNISLAPCFVSGVIDGDGCLYVPDKKERNPVLSVVAEQGSELLLLCCSKYFGDMRPSISKRKGATLYVMYRKELLIRACKHLHLHPILFKKAATIAFLRRCVERQVWQGSDMGDALPAKQ